MSISAPTEVIELENTLNGTILPQDEIIRISEYTHAHGIKLHLDGARIWHVAAVTGTPLSKLVAPFDSASLCFSKGLGAPIGSCLVGSKKFIARARWFRKLFGGGMRQTGMLAASAAYALSNNFPKLLEVHNMALRLEQGLTEIGCKITSPAETCMVTLSNSFVRSRLLIYAQIFYDPSPIGVSYEDIATAAANQSIPITTSGSRLVVHLQTAPEAIDEILGVISKLADEKRAAGFVPLEKITNGSVNSNMYQDVRVHLKK
jgi:threonine aldolase